MSTTVEVFTIGGGDLLQEVFNAIATVFNNKETISAITSMAFLLGGLFAAMRFMVSQDLKNLLYFLGMYVVMTSLVLYPKATIVIEDMTGIDNKPRMVDNLPLSLAIFANVTSRIGVGITEAVETVFHMPDDLTYNKTGMLMGSKLVVDASHFEITDPTFLETINDFMQQCVFYDLLLNKYSVNDLINAENPWEFIVAHASPARAFSFNGTVTMCNTGAGQLSSLWHDIITQAASVYGGQILTGNSNNAGQQLLSYLADGYGFLTQVSEDGSTILQTHLLANAMSSALTHYGADANAPAALTAYEDTKSNLEIREAMDQTGRETSEWLQYFQNIIEAVLYSAFIFVYFFSYFPFGLAIIRNYLCGLFFIQSLGPMYAIINFAASYFAACRSSALITSSEHGLSISNLAGITEVNADAMAIAGFLMWPVTIGGAILLFRGLPYALQSMGQSLSGITQNAASHVAAEAIGGNISVGNTNFGNHSMNNTSANHFDTNARYSAGGISLQQGTGSTLSITGSGSEVLDNRGGISSLGVDVHMAESLRTMASCQAQTSLSNAYHKSVAAGQQYTEGLRQMVDFAQQKGNLQSSGVGYSMTETAGENHAASDVAQLIDSFAKDHHVSHEKAVQVMGQIYADAKAPGGSVSPIGVGGSVGASASGRSAFGSLYSEGKRYAEEHSFVDTVDRANRATREAHFRTGLDAGNRLSSGIASSFDKGDSLRQEAASLYAKSESYSTLASQTKDNAASINANYTQSFYEWMRNQPSSGGQFGDKTFSKSAIDNMAIHDPGMLQAYADRYVAQEKGEAFREFEHDNHLTNGNEHIKAHYQAENAAVLSDTHLHQRFAADNHQIEKMADKNGLAEKIDHSIQQQAMATINKAPTIEQDRTKWQKEKAAPFESHVKEKVKGGVFGSIDGAKGSIIEAIRHPSHAKNILESMKED